jgi:hypothetical protein
MNGYGGTILRVNLTEGRFSHEKTPEVLARDFLGGRGFGASLLFKEVPTGADPLGPDNKLIISSGPFAGMLIPGGGKCDFTCKSPLTGGYASASLGGLFTAEIKYAGLDSIILEGTSPQPVYLFIDGSRTELRDASALWGKGTITVERILKEELGEEFQIAVIGPGGENLVSFASINHDWGRQAGRGGVGAVMGRCRSLSRGRPGAVQGVQGRPRPEELAELRHDNRHELVRRGRCPPHAQLQCGLVRRGRGPLRPGDAREDRHHRQGVLCLPVPVRQIQPDANVRHLR